MREMQLVLIALPFLRQHENIFVNQPAARADEITSQVVVARVIFDLGRFDHKAPACSDAGLTRPIRGAAHLDEEPLTLWQ